MGNRKKKLTSGEATAYLSQKQAQRKLQLSNKDFRHICILKGIYPQEPKHRKKVGKGATFARTYYHVKDIQFLSHEKVIGKLRDLRVYFRKLKRAKERKDDSAVKKMEHTVPRYTLAHIVKERYPSDVDAIRDLDDCLTLMFLFARLPIQKCVYPKLVSQCRRRTIEFMNYIIYAGALRKSFIGIQGIYFEADVRGEVVNWLIPHAVNIETATSLQLKTMQTFVEFYLTMLGFVNYSLYKQVGLFYPPKLDKAPELDNADECLLNNDKDCEFEYLASLAQPLKRLTPSTEEEQQDEAEHMELLQATYGASNFGNEEVTQALQLRRRINNIKRLFAKEKVFLSREVPRELLCLIIRACGGQVSWSLYCGPGATFAEDDLSITYEVVDRPTLKSQFPGRIYVQPQWVVDSLNSAELLPAQHYMPGATLPPHLSPFVSSTKGLPGIKPYAPDVSSKAFLAGNSVTLEDADDDVSESEDKMDDEITETASRKDKEANQAFVLPGKTSHHMQDVPDDQKLKLREKLLPKKHRYLYKKMKFARKREAKNIALLEEKRRKLEDKSVMKSKKIN